MPRRRTPPPLWFELLVVVTIALVLRHFTPAPAPDAIQLAWWQIFLSIVGAVWDGIQAAGQALLAFLQWSLQKLWWFATKVYNGLIDVGKGIQAGGKTLWGFFKNVYDDVLKPAWQKFWTFIQWAKDSLVRLFKPILSFLKELRDTILKFYTKWVKPILDTIELARKVLKVLETLHVEWAKKLDVELAELERRIFEPFRIVLQKVNEIINVVNRVMTADGLFQRLALVKSLVRDARFIGNLWMRNFHRDLTADEQDWLTRAPAQRSIPDAVSNMRAYVLSGSGPDQARIDEAAQDLEIRLRAVDPLA